MAQRNRANLHEARSTSKTKGKLSLKVTLLGTGTSHGVPMIGCECSVCTSTDPRDRRTRTSILIENLPTGTRNPEPESRNPEPGTWNPFSILVDTSTDLRAQALANGVKRV